MSTPFTFLKSEQLDCGPDQTAPARGTRAGSAAARGRAARPREGAGPRRAALTVDVLPVADVLQVAARVLAAQVGVGPVGLQPGVRIPPELGAGRHAARGSVPHRRRPGACGARRAPGAGRRAEARPPPGTDGSAVSSGGGASPWAAGGGAVATSGGGRLPWPPRRPGSSAAEEHPTARLQPPRRPHPAAAMAGAAQAASPRFPLGARSRRRLPLEVPVQAAETRVRGSGGEGATRRGRQGVGWGGLALGSAREGGLGTAGGGSAPAPPRPALAPPLPAALEADPARSAVGAAVTRRAPAARGTFFSLQDEGGCGARGA